MKLPSFLPPLIDLSGTWEEILDKLYEIFERDFKNHRCLHCGLAVIYNNKILPDGQGKEEGFWHVISQESYSSERLIDFRRAERLPWAKPMMERHTVPELKVFDYDHGKRKGIRRYIWLADYDYVLVLQNKGRIYFWITAYYIDSKGRKNDLGSRYANRV